MHPLFHPFFHPFFRVSSRDSRWDLWRNWEGEATGTWCEDLPVLMRNEEGNMVPLSLVHMMQTTAALQQLPQM